MSEGLWAQLGGQAQRERILDEPFRLKLDTEAPVAKRALFDWGGWYRFSLWAIDENLDRDFDGREDDWRLFRQHQLRMWGSLNFDQAHRVYARMKLDFFDWNSGTSYSGRDYDQKGPDLERGWYSFRYSDMLRAYGQTPGEVDFGVKIGREYLELGTGLAMSVPLDMIAADIYWQDFKLTGFGAVSIPSTYNVDRSVPDTPKEDRCFYGLQLLYRGIPDHEPFAYFFWQEDHEDGLRQWNDFNGNPHSQSFGYDSHFVGAGSRGRFLHKDFFYSVEAVGEFGKGYGWVVTPADMNNRQSIHAWAFDTELRWVVPDKNDSQISAGYLLTSGDSDRQFSPSNTQGGNQLNTTDTSFVGWGFRNTGLLLAPRLSNLGMVRLSAETHPLRQVALYKQFVVGVDALLYHKHQADGAISDGLGAKNRHYVGTEFDVHADWRVTSDISLMFRYGVFLPGDAFSTESARHLFFTGVTLNF